MEWLRPTETLLSPDVLTDGEWVRDGYVWRWQPRPPRWDGEHA